MCTCIKAICFVEVLLRCNIAGFEQIFHMGGVQDRRHKTDVADKVKI